MKIPRSVKFEKNESHLKDYGKGRFTAKRFQPPQAARLRPGRNSPASFLVPHGANLSPPDSEVYTPLRKTPSTGDGRNGCRSILKVEVGEMENLMRAKRPKCMEERMCSCRAFLFPDFLGDFALKGYRVFGVPGIKTGWAHRKGSARRRGGSGPRQFFLPLRRPQQKICIEKSDSG